AVWRLEGLVEKARKDASLYRLRAAARLGRGEWAEAVADCDRALARDADDWDALLLRGQAYARSRQWAKAAADFGKNRDVGRDEAEVWHLFALTSLAAGDPDGYRRG